MKSTLLRWMFGAVLATLQLVGHAEDIDLFSGVGTNSSGLAPNLLMIIDNAASFSASASEACVIDGVATALSGTVGGVEQCALYKVISDLTVTDTASFNVGIMVYNGSGVVTHTGAACTGSTGGCLVYPLTGLTTTTKASLLTYIKNWNTSNSDKGPARRWIKASGQATGAVMQEAWAYLWKKTGISGKDYSAETHSTNCKNFVVFIGNAVGANGKPGDSAPGGNGPMESLLGTNPTAAKNASPVATATQREVINLESNVTPATTACGTLNFPTSSHDNSGYSADEWARYMHANRITTYTVGFLGASCQAEYAWLLSSMATHGDGEFFVASDYSTLKKALESIFSQVRSVNSVFAAVSLPVSVNSQGTYLNQVFIGMFRPDANAKPRWNGNLKQYKMGYDASKTFNLLDADDKAAISSSGSEFVSECARSYWTPAATTTGDGYWTSFTDPNCVGYPASSNSPDGNMVEKGGQAYTLRKISPADRVVRTCPYNIADCQVGDTAAFGTTNSDITGELLGGLSTTSTPTRNQLITWARGRNSHATAPETAFLNGSAIDGFDMRPSVHGDVVHSRPAAINFGTDANPKVVVFYGANDGMLRAINGNRTAAITVGTRTIAAGEEFWSFIPPEFYGKLLRRYNNTDTVSTSSRKDYAMDGPITAYRESTGNVWLFVGMRRGGRSIYAFYVNASTLSISLKWKIGCMDDSTTNCSSSAYSGIGQSWSAPQVFTAAGYESGTKKMLVLGGGYDATCEDAITYSCTSTKGNKIYLIDLLTGVVQKTFTTDRPVVADSTIVPGASGHADLIYTADMGGNVYRISGRTATTNISTVESGSPPEPADWTMTKIASLGCATLASCTSPPNRKFMFSPDIVVDGDDYYILLGSGDREKPTNIANTTSNYFFAIKDRPYTADWLNDTANCGSGATSLCLASMLGVTPGSTPSSTDLAAKKGWYLILAGNEQVVTGANAVFGTVYFATHEPREAASNACVPNLGVSRAYAVKYLNGAPARSSGEVYMEREDAGLSPDLVVGKVTLDDGTTVPFCIGCEGPIKPSQPTPPAIIKNPAKIRAYWYIQK